MDTISIRIDEETMNELAKLMRKNHFSTTTEFVREAIRDKMKELEKEEILKQVARLAGSSKRKTTDEMLHVAGEKVFKKLEEKFAR
ncbi:MAG: ribbon-helix-helix domain-containing protein [Nanoarchaeota archaeon]